MHRTLTCLLLAASLLVQRAANACAVPVFRYALERWESDPFQIVVFYRGTLDPVLDKQLTDLEPVMQENAGARANWKVTRVDVDKPLPPLWSSLWDKQKVKTVPSAALCAPEWRKDDDALWSGELNSKTITSLIESPKRKEVLANLLKGTAVVWLLVDTDDKKASDALAAKIDTASTRLLNEIVIPPGIGKDGVDVRSDLPIEVSFATVRMHQNDPGEAMLMRMINNGEPFKEPALLPFFGRARALAAMPASTVNDDLLSETARFLCGACSCQVKAQNPGFDLLIKADWESIFGEQAAPPPEAKLAPATKPLYVPIPKRK